MENKKKRERKEREIYVRMYRPVSGLFSRSDEKANDLDGGSWTERR